MTITYIDEDVRASREDYLQVGCKVCFALQDIPKPPVNEDVTVFRCVHCEAINSVTHNLAQWRKTNFISGCILRLVIVACTLSLLGAVGWAAWLYL